MTGKRMETARDSAVLLRHLARHGIADALMAEVERWERDRARLEAIETAAQELIDLLYTPRECDDGYENDQGQWVSRKALSYVATGRGDPLVDGLRAALGEGQDSDPPRVTHGRHCPCSACARQDWTDPRLAACGMHGPSCPNEYAPIVVAGEGGQDSDLAEPPVARRNHDEAAEPDYELANGPTGVVLPEGNEGGTGGSARSSECPCDGDRGCVCQ